MKTKYDMIMYCKVPYLSEAHVYLIIFDHRINRFTAKNTHRVGTWVGQRDLHRSTVTFTDYVLNSMTTENFEIPCLRFQVDNQTMWYKE